MKKKLLIPIFIFTIIFLSSSAYAVTNFTTQRFFDKNWDGFTTTILVDYSNVTNASLTSAAGWSTSIPTYSVYTPVTHSYNCSVGRADTGIGAIDETSSLSFFMKSDEDLTYTVGPAAERDFLSDGWNYLYWSPGKQLVYDSYNGASSIVTCNASFTKGTWYNIFVDIGTGVDETKIYVNNVMCGVGVSQESDNVGTNMYICDDPAGGKNFAGLLTDMKFWSSRQNNATLRQALLNGSYWSSSFINSPPTVSNITRYSYYTNGTSFSGLCSETSKDNAGSWRANVSASFACPSGSGAAGLFDGVTVVGANDVGAWVGPNLATKQWGQIFVPSTFILSQYEIFFYDNTSSYNPRVWTLYASNDNTTWTSIDYRDLTAGDEGYLTHSSYNYTTTASINYTTYRWNITTAGMSNPMEIPEIKLYNGIANAYAVPSATGHSITFWANATDLDGAADITLTNISITSGTCVNTANSSNGNVFGSKWNCTGIAGVRAYAVVGFRDASNAYVASSNVSEVYPNHVPIINLYTADNFKNNTQLSANYSVNDADADAVNCSLFINNTLNATTIGVTLNTTTVISATGMSVGNNYAWKINCTDFYNSTQTTARTYIFNTPPVLGNPTINSTNASIFEWVNCINGTYSDVNSDAEVTASRTWLWYVNGTSTGITTQSIYLSGNASVGASVICQERAYDGTDYSNYANSSAVSPAYDALLTVYGTLALTGLNITNFNVSTDDGRTFTSSNNVTIIPAVVGHTYLLTLTPVNYSVAYASVTVTVHPQAYQFVIYTANSISIMIYNENGTLVPENVSIKFSSNVTEFTNLTTTAGEFYVDGLNPGVWSLLFSLAGVYAPRTYTVTVANNSHQFLNAYLTNSSSTTLFTILDADTGIVISDVLCTIYKIINGSWTPLESKYSDITGKVVFSYNPFTNYRFFFSKLSYTDNIFFLNPILFSSYDITMSKGSSAINYSADWDGISLTFAPILFNNNQSNVFNWLIAAPGGILTGYGINLTEPSGSSNYTTGINAIGEQLTLNMTPHATNVFQTVRLDYYYITTISGRRDFTFFIPISFPNATGTSNMTFIGGIDRTYGLGMFERILICTIIILMVAGVAAMVGQPLPGLVMALLVFGYMSYIGFVPLWVILPSLFIGIFFLFWKVGGS